MKKILVVAAIMGFSASGALAESSISTQMNTPVKIDREFKTASITPPTEQAQKPTLILRKTDRLPGNAMTATASPEAALQRM